MEKSIKRKPYISKDGYKIVFNPRLYKKSRSKAFRGYYKEHILVVERKFKRKLRKNEEIHHINGDKLDNRLSNLIAVSPRTHKKYHSQLNKLSYELIKSGIIRFNRKTKKYYVKRGVK